LSSFWQNLSVSKKLYVVVGVMALLIATELFTLRFAMSTLSAVRAFVGGEGLWSKSQKDAVISLKRFVRTQDPLYYAGFQKHLEIPVGDQIARLELLKPNPDLSRAAEGFIQGGNNPDDVPGLINLILRFHDISYINRAIGVWTEGDRLMKELINSGESIRTLVLRKAPAAETAKALDQIEGLNDKLTSLENDFSYILGAGSRWLEGLLMISLILAVLTVESTGLFLTISFSRSLSRGLKELNDAAFSVGNGRLDVKVPVRSGDELGQLAIAINKMTESLGRTIQKKVQAESANQTKSLFLANMSHEIRTPLGAIVGFSELLKDPTVTTRERQQYAEIIYRTGSNLTKIINDILDLSKVEAGRLEVEKTYFPLSDLLSEIRSLVELKAGEKSISLKFYSKGALPEFVYTDPLRLRQILVNLLGNAVKFTDHGGVSLQTELSGPNLVFRVTDSGPGIAVEQRERLFQSFSQVDESSTRRYQGTGLGLALSRQLARLLGGDMILEDSQPGQGCTFVVKVVFEGEREIPTTILTKSSMSATNQLTGKKILVVDDVEDNRLLLQRFLSKQGADVVLAHDGSQGVEKARAEYYDVVLMDIQMPIMDGYTATEKLRRTGYSGPIIALTAHAMKEDRTKCLSSGFDDYLTKPIQSSALLTTLSKFGC